MPTPYIGEIRMFAGTYAPAGWNFCDGTIVRISDNPTLFQLIGTTYGGDGQQTFALPDLRSRVPMHQGSNQSNTYVLGQRSGVETVTLSIQQMPQHNHFLRATNTGQTLAPSVSTIPASATASGLTGNINIYSPGTADKTLNGGTIKNDGGSQPHSNIQPYLAVNFIISLLGIFPSQQ